MKQLTMVVKLMRVYKTLIVLVFLYIPLCSKSQSFETYLSRAQQGDVASMSYVGTCLVNGTIVNKDVKQGFKWCYQAAQKGNVDGMAMVGYCYTYGVGVEKNLKEGFRYSLKAAQGGQMGAQYNVGIDYLYGNGVDKNERIAFEWILRSAVQGYPSAEAQVGYSYSMGIGVEKDIFQGFQWNLKAAQHGVANAQYNVAWNYYNGIATKVDNNEAFKWFLKSANQGYSLAQGQVGHRYLNGIGVDKDEKKAYEWFLKAANNGDVQSMLTMGYICFNGIGTDVDRKASFTWYLNAAKLGDVSGQCMVARMYLDGDGVLLDERKGFEWALKSAEGGFASSQWGVAKCYADGVGTKQDYKKAFYWYQKAAEQNLGDAYKDLAYCYILGHGVNKNVAKAFEMIDKAIEIDPNNLNYKDSKGELYSIVGERGKALMLFDEIVEVNPSFFKDVESQLYQYVKKVRGIDNVDIDIPQFDTNSPNTFVVVVANENYKRVENVPFALNDGEIFAEYCKKTLGVPEQNIHLVKDATLNDLKFNIKWLQNVLKVFDGEASVIFYYAGHGIPDEQSKTAFLLPVDGYGTDVSTGYSLEDLYKDLGKLPSKEISVFLDACFSGAKRDGGILASARGVAIKVKSVAPMGNMVVFSAAQNDETAFPYKEQKHGLFTYYLLKKLQESKGNVTLGDLAEFVKSQVEKQSIVINGKLQSPSIVGPYADNVNWKLWKLK